MKNQNEQQGPTGSKGPQNHPFSITVVVGGDDQKLNVKPDDIASEVLEVALKKSKNVGQPASDWELKTEGGAAIALAGTLASLGIKEGDVLFASLKAGAAG